MEYLGSSSARAAQKYTPERDTGGVPQECRHARKLDTVSSHLMRHLEICRGGNGWPGVTTTEGKEQAAVGAFPYLRFWRDRES